MLYSRRVLARIRPSSNPSIAGNNICRGQSLTQIRQPQPALAQRSLYLASTVPITISSQRDRIDIVLENGEAISQKLLPTPKVSPVALRDQLTQLLQTREPSDQYLEQKNAGLMSFRSSEWFLDPEGDAIHRHVAANSANECDEIERLIGNKADIDQHHPHITRGDPDRGDSRCMTVTCTTHNPRGLGIRDLRLALAINAILDKFNLVYTPDWPRQTSLSLRNDMIAQNRHKINDALQSCGCH
jgi:pterin-4a-carbinolamine dehydratase